MNGEKLFQKINQHWVKCLLCQAENFLITPYYKCYGCINVDIKDFAYQPNQFESEQKKELEKIVKHLIPINTPAIVFVETCLHPQEGNPSWGWINRNLNNIFIPRKSLYLPNNELTDLIVHEINHFVSGEKFHNNRSWYFKYRQLREEVFQHFATFASFSNPHTRFSKGYEIYPSIYEEEYNQIFLKKDKK